jgi:cation transport ATPase
LRDEGVRVVMVTGDDRVTAEAVARMLASAAMSLSSVSVIGNALRLRRLSL